MWRKLYTNSGPILLAVLAAGVWFHNLRPHSSANPFDFATVASPAPRMSAEEILGITPSPTSQPFEQFRRQYQVSATAICADGSYSYSASRRGACSRHGGVAPWLSRRQVFQTLGKS
jgi:hypothetical protein